MPGPIPLAQGVTSVRVRTSLTIARTVWTPRLRRPPMVPCTADTSAPPTAISAQDYSASVGSSSALTANAIYQRPDGQPGVEFCVNHSGATEHMTQNRAGLEDYSPAPAGDKVECAGGNFHPVAGYGRLRLLVRPRRWRFQRPDA